MAERANAATFKGSPLTLAGPEIRVGDQAPHFKLVGNDLADINCESLHGKVRVLSVAPSIDTPVCSTQTRTFNKINVFSVNGKMVHTRGECKIRFCHLQLPFLMILRKVKIIPLLPIPSHRGREI